jgi:hypothetical protein
MIHVVAPDFNSGALRNEMAKSSQATDHHWENIMKKSCGYTVPVDGQRMEKKKEYFSGNPNASGYK